MSEQLAYNPETGPEQSYEKLGRVALLTDLDDKLDNTYPDDGDFFFEEWPDVAFGD